MCVTMTLKRVLMISLTLICLVGALSVSVPKAHAAGPVQVTFTVRQQFANNSISAPPSEVFTYQLSPQTPGAPMPQGSGMQAYRFSIKGTSDVDIGPISFSTPGLYVYALSCTTAEKPGYSQNRKMYTIEVHISNESEASVIYLGDDAKAEELAFERIYNDNNQPGKSVSDDIRSPNTQNPSVTGPKTSAIGPKTGDFSNPALWIALITFSSVLLMFIILIGRKLSISGKQARGRKE